MIYLILNSPNSEIRNQVLETKIKFLMNKFLVNFLYIIK
jgi:hypothetical protein